ncbi:Translation initiation factor IF-2 [Babesia microti strain RI]|uniref:Translation initiation factor IF-2 n=1 Tax=Babesia microti (strain RI) TaxID=1133968 RepID=A0A1R4ABW7_BABMR|nr:Translation initiation factor IF-2 [Babesia microti strain RI]SJK86435.1 Translation initiation factor IF-2 [Babesia microti strain RI]|eukprot:XP_021338592.1 Translation initiation factor IF-2 [Babesia microti strain RI]
MLKSLALLYKGRHIPVGRLKFKNTLTKGWKQKSPEILLPPFIPIHELRIMLRLDYDTCFKACNVAIGDKNYYWKDKEGRQFQSNSKRGVILPFELAAYASSSFGYKPIMVNPEPTWQDFQTKNSVPVGVLVGHANHGKSTLFDALAGTKYSKIEPITQNMRSIYINDKITLIDTPGHELFEILRGRCIHLADFALVIVSLECGGEIQTRDVIIQADRFKVPIIFVLTKSDLPHIDPELTIAELRNQLLNMYHEGIISRDYTNEVNKAISVSSITGDNVDRLYITIFDRLKNCNIPFNPIKPMSLGGEDVKKYHSFIRKSDALVGANATPASVGLIVDMEKRHDRGVLLSVVVRHGVMVKGNHFVAGTAFGRIKRIYLDGQEVQSASVGQCVQIHGLKPYGNATTDDLIMTLPIHSAFRLSQYRINISLLKEAQKSGRPIDIPFGIDNITTHEVHQLEMITSLSEINMEDTDKSGIGDNDDGDKGSILLEPKSKIDEEIDTGSDLPSSENKTASAGKGRKSRFLKRDWIGNNFQENLDTNDDSNGYDYENDRHYANELHEPEKISISNRYVLERWDTRIQQREIEQQRQTINKRTLLVEAEQLRRRVLGEPQLTSDEIERFISADIVDSSVKAHTSVVSFDKKLVVSVIMRTSFVGSLDMLLDGFEKIENEFGVRIPLVHGGIGPIGPTDVIHAEIENRLSRNVPIYAFQVPILADAVKHAILNKVTIIKFDLFSDLLDHLRDRCRKEISKAESRNKRDWY